MTKTHTILVADDHPLFLKGLEEQLRLYGYKILASVSDGDSALKAVLSLKPDLAILDIQMPGLTGIEVATEAKKQGCQSCFILLSFHQEQEIVEQAKALDIDGYMTKEDTASDLRSCIQQVLAGDKYFSSNIAEKKHSEAIDEFQQQLEHLSRSEYKILRLIAQGNSNADIAKLLFISERTVEKHRSNIILKLKLPKQTHSLSNWASEYKENILGFSL